MKHRYVLGLDVDGDTCYAVGMRRRPGGPSLQFAVRAPAGGDLQASLRQCITGLPSGQSVPPAAAAAIPRRETLQCLLPIPSLNGTDTKAAVMSAVEDRLPFPASELCLGWVRTGGNGPAQVAAARRSAVEACRTALASAGFVPARVDLRPLAAAAALLHGHGSELAGRPAVLIELRSDECSLIRFQRGGVVYARALPGLGKGSREELAGTVGEVKIALALLQSDPDWGEPGTLWFAGAHARDEETRESFARSLGMGFDTCRLAIPATIPRRAATPPLGPEMMVPFGLCLGALGAAAAGPDLLSGLSNQDQPSGSRLAWALPLALSAVLALSGLGVRGASKSRETNSLEAWLAANQGRLDELARLEEESRAMADRLAYMAGYGGGSLAYLDFLLALDGGMPAGARLSRIVLAGAEIETVEGSAPSVSLMLEKFRGDDTLSRLRQIGPVRARTRDGVEVEDFALSGPIPSEGAPQ